MEPDEAQGDQVAVAGTAFSSTFVVRPGVDIYVVVRAVVQVLDLEYFQNYKTWNGNYKQHNETLKWLFFCYGGAWRRPCDVYQHLTT